MKKSSFLTGTVIGAVAGAVAGVLLAPKSGKETRADIAKKAKEVSSDLHDKLTALSDEVSTKVAKLKEVASDLQGEAKEESQVLIKQAEVLKQDLRIAATNLAKDGAAVKDSTMKNVKPLIAEAGDVLKELERVTKTLASSAKGKLSSDETAAK